MRVITGKYKGRKLISPADNDIRPTTDKSKEALFSILANEVYGSRVLDLFAGTGSLGIEALSRGAEYCFFADASGKSIGIIKENLEHCKVIEKTRVVPGDYRKILKNLSDRVESGVEEPFDIILLDPPYDKGLLQEAFRIIREGNILEKNGTIVAEHRKEEILPDKMCGFVKTKEKKYGIVILSIYNNA